MDYVPMPEVASKRFSYGFGSGGVVAPNMVEPMERYTALMAEVDPRFEFQQVKIKWGTYRVYVSAGEDPFDDTLTDEEWEVGHDAYILRGDKLRELAGELEVELTALLDRA